MNQYKFEEDIGEGGFGTVVKAKSQKGLTVAVKLCSFGNKCEAIPTTTIREISILNQLTHPNIVQLFDVYLSKTDVCLVLEYGGVDLEGYMEENALSPSDIKDIMMQLCEGVRYCHSKLVVHRDLKPGNLLISVDDVREFGEAGGLKSTKLRLRIADFGLGRGLSGSPRTYSPILASLCYTAPEILLGGDDLSCSLDMWSVGCIFAEMCTTEVLFDGFSQRATIIKIFEFLGTPTAAEWQTVSADPHTKDSYPQLKRDEEHHLFASTGDGGILLEKLLKYNPRKRLSAKDALKCLSLKSFGLKIPKRAA